MGKASGEQVRYRNIIGSDECSKWWWELPFVRLLLLLGWQREDVEEEPSDREEGIERERERGCLFWTSFPRSRPLSMPSDNEANMVEKA